MLFAISTHSDSIYIRQKCQLAALHCIFCCSVPFSAAKAVFSEGIMQRSIVPGKWLRPNHVRCIPRPSGSILCTQEILDPSVHYPVLDHHLESSPYPTGTSDLPRMIQRAIVPEKWLRPNHVRYIRIPTGSVLSTQEILDPSVHYPVLDHHLESSPYSTGTSDMPCMIQRAIVPGKWLRLNHVRYIPRPTGSDLSTQKILDPSIH